MNKWRPEVDWITQRNNYLNRNTLLALSVENINTYEAGADAMLKALKEEGLNNLYMYMRDNIVVQRTEKGQTSLDLVGFDSKKLGYVVFIPDDKEVK